MIRLTPAHNILGVALLLAVCAPAVSAASLDAIRSQINQGHYQQAVSQSDSYLTAHPDDRDARFVRAVALARLGKTDAAIQAFGELARDNPKLPEPANNLAVLYARQGDYEKARRWLEAAMATHPAYNIAHKNLGDVYTALAAVAYSKALDQQEQPSDLGVNLQMVDKLYEEAPEIPAVAQQQAQPQTKPQPQPATPAGSNKGTRVVEAPAPKPEPVRPPQKTTQPQASTPQAQAAGTETGPGSAAAADPADIMPAIQAWADAWSDQDVDAYLDAYANNFYPGDDLTLSQWQAQRRDRVASPEFIKVKILNPKVESVEGDRARVSFQQAYESGSYSDRVNKTLVMQYKAGAWRIVREISQPL